jgi:hypothetical protein
MRSAAWTSCVTTLPRTAVDDLRALGVPVGEPGRQVLGRVLQEEHEIRGRLRRRLQPLPDST